MEVNMWWFTSALAFGPAPDQVVTLPQGLNASELVGGDLDGDGYDDLVATTYDGQAWRCWRFAGSPAGLLGVTALPCSGSSATLVDLDGDGADDLVDIDLFTQEMTTWHGGTNPSAQPWSVTPVYVAGLGGVGDLNGDGRGDLVLTDTGAPGGGLSHTEVYYGSAAGLAAVPDLSLQDNPYALAVTDADGDGFDDLVKATSTRLLLHPGGPAGIGPAPAWSGPSPVAGGLQYLLGGGDVDGDGFEDLLVSGTWDLYVVRGAASGLGASRLAPYNQGREATTAFLPDVDGDGDDEVLMGDPDWGAQSAGRALRISGGTGAVPSMVHGAAHDWVGLAVGAGDFDGNGIVDTAVGDVRGGVAIDYLP